MRERRGWRALPDALTAARVVLTLAAYPVAWSGPKGLFAVMVLVIVLTDILDGPIARRGLVADGRGADLDSAADFLFYGSLPVWTWIYQPDVVRALLPIVGGLFAAYVVANVVNRLRRGTIGFHNRMTRTTGTVGVVAAMWTILFGPHPLVFGVLVIVMGADLIQRFVGAFTARPPAARASPAGPAPSERKE